MRKALGDALYSRFDSLVHFESLSRKEICQVIDRVVDNRVINFTPDEQSILQSENVKTKLYPLADKSGNARKLGKLVDEVISLVLVRAVLSGTSQDNNSPNVEDAA